MNNLQGCPMPILKNIAHYRREEGGRGRGGGEGGRHLSATREHGRSHRGPTNCTAVSVWLTELQGSGGQEIHVQWGRSRELFQENQGGLLPALCFHTTCRLAWAAARCTPRIER